MKILRLSTLFITILLSLLLQSQDADKFLLKYNQPANNWYEALPIGNGRLGAMVLGGFNNERIQLNLE